MTDYSVTWITPHLATGPAPMSYADLDAIRDQGIDAIINLCAEFSDLHDIEAGHGFEVHYLPVFDEDTPAMDDMEKTLEWLDEAVYLGKKVLVHCRHGIGRTGTLVTSFLMRKGLSLNQATRKLKGHGTSPSSYRQWSLLRQYGKQSGRLTIREPSLEFKNRVDLSLFFSEYESLAAGIPPPHGRTGAESGTPCGRDLHKCCFEPFDIPLIECIYLHTRINRQSRELRQALIDRSVTLSKEEKVQCPLLYRRQCRLFDIRPVRCRTFGLQGENAPGKKEITDLLTVLSRNLFLALSGRFLADGALRFSVRDAVSGKFVQACFHYLSSLETDPS